MLFADISNPLRGDPYAKTPIALQPGTWLIVGVVLIAAYFLLRASTSR